MTDVSAQRTVTSLLGFGSALALPAVVGLVAIPILVGRLGADSWGSLVVLQTVSMVTGVCVAFGWGVTGPAQISATNPALRATYLAASLPPRLYLLLVLSPIAMAITWALTSLPAIAVVPGVLAYVIPSAGAGWYYIGTARPWRLVAMEAVPVTLGTVAGLLAVLLDAGIPGYVICQLGGAIVAVSAELLDTLGRTRIVRAGWTASVSLRRIRDQRHAASAVLAATMYVAWPTLAVQLWVPGSLPSYALADRLLRYASAAVAPLQQHLQGRVPRSAQRGRAMRSALKLGLVVGLGGGVLIAALSPLVADLLTAGAVAVPSSLSIPLGVAFIGIATSAIAAYVCLAALGLSHAIARSNFLGLVIIGSGAAIAAIAGSVEGVAWAVASGELVLASVQVIVLLTSIRRIGQGG